MESDRLLRLPQVMRLTSRSKSAIRRDIIDGVFPTPVRIGKRAIAWRNSDITEWIESRQEVRGYDQ